MKGTAKKRKRDVRFEQINTLISFTYLKSHMSQVTRKRKRKERIGKKGKKGKNRKERKERIREKGKKTWTRKVRPPFNLTIKKFHSFPKNEFNSERKEF